MKILVVTGVNSSDILTGNKSLEHWPEDVDLVVGIWPGGKPVVMLPADGVEVQELHYRHMKPPEILESWSPADFQADIQEGWSRP